jgi:hypothetical protein
VKLEHTDRVVCKVIDDDEIPSGVLRLWIFELRGKTENHSLFCNELDEIFSGRFRVK